MNTEQERSDFEAWHTEAFWSPVFDNDEGCFIPRVVQSRYEAYQAGRADTRSSIQNLEASRDGYRDDARALHDALTRMVAMYEHEFDHENTHKWRPDWLVSALARRNALEGNHDN